MVRYRIVEACRELRHPNVPVTNVAHSVGFNDPSYFARVFRRFVGVSPSEYSDQPNEPEIEQRVSDLKTSLRSFGLDSVQSRSPIVMNISHGNTRESIG